MAKNLVIVESPAKARTIEKFLGKDYTVKSSIGHIRDIPTKAAKGGKPPIDIANNFATIYEVDPEKKKLIAELKKDVKTAETVWLASDEDREGEAIAWHLCETLGLDPKTTKRIVFHEITKSAIEEALKTPRTVDMNLVNAQQARRVLDRLVGFELSPVIQRKVPGGKSAGRVQSPAVRLLVEREREINAFQPVITYKVTGEFNTSDGTPLNAELADRFKAEADATTFLESLIPATFNVGDVTTSPSTRNPGAPFTTSSLQQEAASRLGFSVRTTMTAAQRLYQEGKITYMRTDSVNLSKQALASMSDYITSEFGKDYHHFRTFKTKSAGAQEAHEAIRPTDVSTTVASDDSYEQRLYELIRSRTLASQMAPAKLENTTITIKAGTDSRIWNAKGQVVIFDGYLKVYGAKQDDTLLPPLKAGDPMTLIEAHARQSFSRPPARYTEGSLVKKLEELGIGRPSTYATIISTIQARGYAVKGESEGTPREVIDIALVGGKVSRAVETENTGSDRGKLVPTSSGNVVSDFLEKHFEQVVDYGFTADVEEDFDKIADGKQVWYDMLRGFYGPFHKLIEGSADISRSEAAQAREVGTDPKTGKMIYARFGRYGPMLQLGATEDEEEKPQFATLPKGARIETVTLEQALQAFELPRLVGTTEDGKEIKASIGRFGPYIQVDKLFVSLKEDDPHTIEEAKARELYKEKLAAEAAKNIQNFGKIKVLNGRFGPYVTDGKKNAKIPKDTDPAKLTEAEAEAILKAAPAKKKFPTRRRATKK